MTSTPHAPADPGAATVASPPPAPADPGAAAVASPAPSAAPPATATPAAPITSPDEFFLPLVERSINIPKKLMLPFVGAFVTHDPTVKSGPPPSALILGAVYGLTDQVNIDATVAAVGLTPAVSYFGPTIGATFQAVLQRDFEVALAAHVTISAAAQGNRVAPLELAMPVFIRPVKTFRIETGGYMPIRFGGGASSVGLRIPANFLFQVHPNVHLGLTTGVSVRDLGAFDETYAVPLGFAPGYSVNIHGVWLDVLPSFSFPAFLTPTAPASASKIHTDLWVAGLVVDASFSL